MIQSVPVRRARQPGNPAKGRRRAAVKNRDQPLIRRSARRAEKSLT